LNLYGFVGNDGVNARDLFGLSTDPCNKAGDIELKSFTFTANFGGGKSYSGSDPNGFVKDYLKDYVKGKTKDAARKRSDYLDWMLAVKDDAKDFLGRFGAAVGLINTGNWVLDTLELSADFKCEKDDAGNTTLFWTDITADVIKDGPPSAVPSLNLHIYTNSNDRNRAVTEVGKAMLSVAREAVKKCSDKKK